MGAAASETTNLVTTEETAVLIIIDVSSKRLRNITDEIINE